MSVNWMGDINPFNLEQPPEWWMKGLYDFDHLLVLLPSQMRTEYLLTRRRTLSQVNLEHALLDNKNLDTNFCVRNGLLPIAPLKWKTGANMVFSQRNLDSLLKDLRARDTWSLTGGPLGDVDAAWQAVEAQESAIDLMARAKMKDDFYHMGRDAYRSLKARTGQRSRLSAQPPDEQRVILTDVH